MKTNEIDFIQAGSGDKVILVHSSGSGAKQWRSLMEPLAENHHVIAINLFGYGKTRAWKNDIPQSLEDQARLIEQLVTPSGEEFSIVGHSFGGSVAMKAAALFKGRVRRLVLVEPNPFYLLDKYGCKEAFQEAAALRDLIKKNGKAGTWAIAAEGFANYWAGVGSWDAMSSDRQFRFAKALKPNFHEWDAVMNEQTSFQEWEADLPERTTVLSAADTVRSIAEIVALMAAKVSGWRFKQIERGGHMAVMTKPELINPMIIDALS